jgi:hypothetical protein
MFDLPETHAAAVDQLQQAAPAQAQPAQAPAPAVQPAEFKQPAQAPALDPYADKIESLNSKFDQLLNLVLGEAAGAETVEEPAALPDPNDYWHNAGLDPYGWESKIVEKAVAQFQQQQAFIQEKSSAIQAITTQHPDLNTDIGKAMLDTMARQLNPHLPKHLTLTQVYQEAAKVLVNFKGVPQNAQAQAEAAAQVSRDAAFVEGTTNLVPNLSQTSAQAAQAQADLEKARQSGDAEAVSAQIIQRFLSR